MGIVQTEFPTGSGYVRCHALVIGIGIIGFFRLAERVFAQNGQVQHLVFAFFVPEGIFVLREGGLDGFPSDEVFMRTFLQTDDVRLERTDEGGCLL